MKLRRSRGRAGVGLLLGLLLIGLFGAACAQRSEQQGEIVIGAIGAMTGSSAELGNNLKQGVELALDRINDSGGINGRKVRVVYRDGEADANRSVAALQELLTKENVVAIVGPTNTAPATAMLPYVQEAKIGQMNGGSTGTNLIDPQKYPYTFRTIFNNEIMAMEMVNYAVKVRGWQRLAILHDKTALGVGGAADLQRFVKEAGLTPVTIESYNAGDTDLTPQMVHVRDARVEAILSWALGVDTAHALKTMRNLGFKVPYVGYSGALLKTTRDLAGDAIGDAVATAPGRFAWADDPSQVDPLVREFIVARDTKFGADDKISLAGVAAHYDGMMLLAEAMKRAKSTDGNAVRATLETIKDYRGIVTDYSFGPDDHEGFAQGAMKLVYLAQEWKGTFKLAPTK